MKGVYLALSIIFTGIILVLAIQNMDADCGIIKVLNYNLPHSFTLLALGMGGIGIITGALYHAFMARVLTSPDDDE